MQTLLETLEQFAAKCNHDERLCEMNRDWNRTVAILAEDDPAGYWIRCEGGKLSVGGGPVTEADLEIRASADILQAVFSGLLAPAEPYNAGDLTVRGNQDDLMRLDIITLLLWGE